MTCKGNLDLAAGNEMLFEVFLFYLRHDDSGVDVDGMGDTINCYLLLR
jgi:hypothetical protein